MRTTNRIRKVSKKQAQKNRAIADIKKTLGSICIICKKYGDMDPAHLLPRSTYPEYYIKDWNIVGMCRCCHSKFDNDLSFRQEQKHLFERVHQHDKQAAYQYFKINN